VAVLGLLFSLQTQNNGVFAQTFRVLCRWSTAFSLVIAHVYCHNYTLKKKLYEKLNCTQRACGYFKQPASNKPTPIPECRLLKYYIQNIATFAIAKLRLQAHMKAPHRPIPTLATLPPSMSPHVWAPVSRSTV